MSIQEEKSVNEARSLVTDVECVGCTAIYLGMGVLMHPI